MWIFALSVPAFWFGRVAFSSIIDKRELTAYGACWLLVVFSAFLLGSFWAYLGFLSFCILAFSAKSSLSGLKLFFLLICALPYFEKDIPGIGSLERVISLNHYKVLALVILLPLVWKSPNRSKSTFQKSIDAMVVSLFLLSSLLVFRQTTLTDTIRQGLDLFVGMYLPYMAMSRAIVSFDDLQEIMIAYIVPLLAISLVGFLEFWRWWHLYAQLNEIWGIYGENYGYLTRFGRLRAYASISGGPIVMGYCLLIALGFLLAFWKRNLRVSYAVTMCFVLFVGMISTQSRGPMVGVLVMVLAFALTSRAGMKMGMRYMSLMLLALPLLLLTPAGQDFMTDTPAGAEKVASSEEDENIDYRARLLEKSMIVIARYPWFGSIYYSR